MLHLDDLAQLRTASTRAANRLTNLTVYPEYPAGSLLIADDWDDLAAAG